MLLPYIGTRSTTRTSVRCLSQCNHAPGTCPEAQNTVWNKKQKNKKQKQQQHISNVTTACMIQLHILVCCILHSLADNHVMVFIEEGMELCAQLTVLSSTSLCLPNPMVPRMILSLATAAMVTCSHQETGVVRRMIITSIFLIILELIAQHVGNQHGVQSEGGIGHNGARQAWADRRPASECSV